MAVLLERGIQIIATETYSVKAGKLVIATSREQGLEATHIAIIEDGDSIASLVATKDARLVTLPNRMENKDVSEDTLITRALAIDAIANVDNQQSGMLLTSLKNRLQSEGINFSRDFTRIGTWAEYRRDWKAKITEGEALVFSQRFHGLDESLDSIDRTAHFQLQNAKLEELSILPELDLARASFN